MSKILGMDYGKIITGLSITDEKKIFAFGLNSVLTKNLMNFLESFLDYEKIEKIVVGLPKKLNNQKEVLIETEIQKFLNKFRMKYPKIILKRLDERFTSKIAFDTMIKLGLKKKKRRKKIILNQISATLILQSYLTKKEKKITIN
ncbi:Holliday junction resolvase RuvX [Blattabacterium cuenoti]|uniref:Putative pre-16S rRNA nuclease n=1 Tax=Blattabacterium cuenoti STAT TaxID=1457030 RepID=A0A224AJS7_9FLAO|nr:Holliday junction resolvase RuvX [Blattabacterium cuenoti]BBA17114.1 Holliday junction resolvase-like protein [Blattabacterium cuenoti STAT]